MLEQQLPSVDLVKQLEEENPEEELVYGLVPLLDDITDQVLRSTIQNAESVCEFEMLNDRVSR